LHNIIFYGIILMSWVVFEHLRRTQQLVSSLLRSAMYKQRVIGVCITVVIGMLLYCGVGAAGFQAGPVAQYPLTVAMGGPVQAVTGSVATYTVSVRNVGNGTLHNVLVSVRPDTKLVPGAGNRSFAPDPIGGLGTYIRTIKARTVVTFTITINLPPVPPPPPST